MFGMPTPKGLHAMKEEPMHQVLEDAPADHSRDRQERDSWPLSVRSTYRHRNSQHHNCGAEKCEIRPVGGFTMLDRENIHAELLGRHGQLVRISLRPVSAYQCIGRAIVGEVRAEGTAEALVPHRSIE